MGIAKDTIEISQIIQLNKDDVLQTKYGSTPVMQILAKLIYISIYRGIIIKISLRFV